MVNVLSFMIKKSSAFSTNIYLLIVNNGDTAKMCEICLKLTIKTPKPCHWHHSSVFIVIFEKISNCSGVSINTFEQVSIDWVRIERLLLQIRKKSKLISNGLNPKWFHTETTETLWGIWYTLHNLKNKKNTRGRVLL